LHQNRPANLYFDAFSSREPASTPHQVRGRLSLENAMVCYFDAFSSREPVSTPHQVRGRLSLENAMAYAAARQNVQIRGISVWA
jgi:hypothetical protein